MRVRTTWFSCRHLLASQAVWAAGALWLAAVMWAFMNGPGLHAADELEIANEADVENRIVCERLSMPLGSEGYPSCASELGQVRRLQRERLERHGTGFL